MLLTTLFQWYKKIKIHFNKSFLALHFKKYDKVFLLIHLNPFHTASSWNIIIQWTSYDDLTEKLVSLFSLAKLVKWQQCETALCDLTEDLFQIFKSIPRPNAWMDPLEKKCIISVFNLFFAGKVLFTVNDLL